MRKVPVVLLIFLTIVGCRQSPVVPTIVDEDQGDRLHGNSNIVPEGVGPTAFGQEGPYAVVGGLVDGLHSTVRTGMAVLVKNGKIDAIVPANEVPAGMKTFGDPSLFICPGLWDMHVHWFDERDLGLFLANGVTGIRIMSGATIHLDWRRRIETGKLLGPRMYIASTLVDGPNAFWKGSVRVANAAEAKQAVDRLIDTGYDFIKVYSNLPRDAYFGVVAECKKRKFDFEGHVPFSITADEAVHAGQRTIEHQTQFNTASKLPGGEATLAADMAKEGTWWCPTFAVRCHFKGYAAPGEKDQDWYRYMPKEVRDRWPVDLPQYADANGLRGSFGDQVQQVGRFSKAGVGILAGTDTWMPFVYPGFSLPGELEYLVMGGLTPAQALNACTVNAGKLMRRKDVGVLEKGAVADLVLLRDNPLANIGNVRSVESVVSYGRYYDRAALDKMLADAQALAPQ